MFGAFVLRCTMLGEQREFFLFKISHLIIGIRLTTQNDFIRVIEGNKLQRTSSDYVLADQKKRCNLGEIRATICR